MRIVFAIPNRLSDSCDLFSMVSMRSKGFLGSCTSEHAVQNASVCCRGHSQHGREDA